MKINNTYLARQERFDVNEGLHPNRVTSPNQARRLQANRISVFLAMSANVDIRLYTGENVLLPGSQAPRPATILISSKTGKIIAVHEGRHVRADYPDIVDDHWVDAGDRYLLPGLIEYVGPLPIVLSLRAPTVLVVQRACTPQRAWADGLGGFLDGHACRSVGGRYHRRGHAAQLDTADDDGGESCDQTWCGARAMLDRRRVLGWRHPRQPGAQIPSR